MTDKEKAKTALIASLGRVLNASDLFVREKIECLQGLLNVLRDGLCEFDLCCEAPATTRNFCTSEMSYALNVCDKHRKELAKKALKERRKLWFPEEEKPMSDDTNPMPNPPADASVYDLAFELMEKLDDAGVCHGYDILEMRRALGGMGDYFAHYEGMYEGRDSDGNILSYGIPLIAYCWKAFADRIDPAAPEAMRRAGKLVERLLPWVIAEHRIDWEVK